MRPGAWWSQRVWSLSRDSKGCREAFRAMISCNRCEVQRAFDEARDQEELPGCILRPRQRLWSLEQVSLVLGVIVIVFKCKCI